VFGGPSADGSAAEKAVDEIPGLLHLARDDFGVDEVKISPRERSANGRSASVS
jgi:hypothetical protein